MGTYLYARYGGYCQQVITCFFMCDMGEIIAWIFFKNCFISNWTQNHVLAIQANEFLGRS